MQPWSYYMHCMTEKEHATFYAFEIAEHNTKGIVYEMQTAVNNYLNGL